TDEGIQTELDIYNPLIPAAGQVSATLFVELTDKAQLEEWLPKLVGIETEVELRLGVSGQKRVRCQVDEAHLRQLTREETTASVHYVRFELDDEEIAVFEQDPVVLALTHPSYAHEVELGEDTKRELLTDLRGGS
ncbi:MAG TPA: DUF3501 family protein, partial [Acidimicrobiales bacterium]|nr:DUF3501 family protein [Acidimicrobiales bacterium]